MGENVLRRFCNNILAVIREISVEPAYLGMALSWGLYGIVSSELYIQKVRERKDHCGVHTNILSLNLCKISIECNIIFLSKVCKVNLALGDEICDNIQGLGSS